MDFKGLCKVFFCCGYDNSWPGVGECARIPCIVNYVLALTTAKTTGAGETLCGVLVSYAEGQSIAYYSHGP